MIADPVRRSRSWSGSRELPLSFAQQRVWFLDQLEPGNPFYNLPSALRLKGKLDETALAKSLVRLMQRHQALRTTFPAEGGRPRQEIAEEPTLSLRVEEVAGEEAARRVVEKEVGRGFDLVRGPLLRALVVRLGEKDQVLMVNLHHIVSDRWSMGVLWRELSELYGAALRGEEAELEDLQLQYADYALWEREQLRGKELVRQLGYWRERLEACPVLELPSDRMRPAVKSYRGGSVTFRLDRELTEGLRGLARAAGATMFMTLLAGFQALLSRYTGLEDVVVGTPIANRSREDTEGLIGFFLNTLPMRTDSSGDPSFEELIARVREVALGAYEHSGLPFEKLVEELQPERDLSHEPLIGILFAHQGALPGELKLGELVSEPYSFENRIAKFDLDVSMAESRELIRGSVQYSTDLFDGWRVERLIGHYRRLLEAAVAEPWRRISGLPLMTGEEKEELAAWSGTEREYPHDRCVHELVEEQVERTPHAEAVVWEGERLSYGELNRRANRLAHHLRRLGVGPEVVVGICLERSLEMVVAMLGVLKAGGAYLPMDTEYPAERLGFMVADAGARVVVTRSELLGRLPELGCRVVCLDQEAGALGGREEGNPASGVRPGNMAYVIYTSGSTGLPKPVAIQHQAAANLLYWIGEQWSPAELSGVLAASSISFDCPLFELFGPLSWGGRAVLVRSALELPSVGLEQKLSLLSMVPSAMGELLETGAVPRLVRTVNLHGDAVSSSLVTELYARTPVERVLNLYGPSEATTFSTCGRLEGDGPMPPPIGRPVANVRVHVLDRRLQPVPVGVVGELYIGGMGLARGYLGRPGLTAERFVPDPSGEAGARLYRTGDLGRYLPDGNLEFLGREDQQVKVRGYRVELGEVEAALSGHPAVREVVVTAPRGSDGVRRLVGYVVGEEASPKELREYLRERLPEYMVPTSFVSLKALPLTANCKVDRQALPPPELERDDRGTPYLGPRTATERALSEIWASVLGFDRVGIDDNFFELGGQSLEALRLVARIQDTFGKRIGPAALFQHTTIASLADELTRSETGPSGAESSGLRSDTSDAW